MRVSDLALQPIPAVEGQISQGGSVMGSRECQDKVNTSGRTQSHRKNGVNCLSKLIIIVAACIDSVLPTRIIGMSANRVMARTPKSCSSIIKIVPRRDIVQFVAFDFVNNTGTTVHTMLFTDLSYYFSQLDNGSTSKDYPLDSPAQAIVTSSGSEPDFLTYVVLAFRTSSNKAGFKTHRIVRVGPFEWWEYVNITKVVNSFDLPATRSFTAATSQDGSNYAFYVVRDTSGTATDGSFVLRTDYTFINATTTDYFFLASSVMNDLKGLANSIDIGSADTVVSCHGDGKINIANSMSLSRVQMLASGVNCFRCRFSNVTYNRYIVMNLAATTGVYDLDVYQPSLTVNYGPYTLAGKATAMVNVHAYQYYMFLLDSTTEAKVQLVNANLASTQPVQVFILSSNPTAPGCLTGPGHDDPLNPLFGVHYPYNNTFQMYRLYPTMTDNCTLRNGETEICQTCPPGSYRNHLNSRNLCILLADFPPGFGADNSTQLMKKCAVLGCLTCTLDYTTCTACDVSKGYYSDVALGLTPRKWCLPTELIPPGFGVSSTTVVACQMAGCLECKLHAAQCTKCSNSSSPAYYLDVTSTPSTCILASQIQIGDGINKVLGTVELCPPGCLECKDNVIFCTKCDTSSGYFLTDENICFAATDIRRGYRADYVSGVVEACKEGCSKCPASKTTCTECFSENNYFHFPNNTCALVTALSDGFGVSGTEIVPCAVAQCKICKLDASKCQECKVMYLLNTVTNSVCDLDIYTKYSSLEISQTPSTTADPMTQIFNIYFDPVLDKAADQEPLLKELALKMAVEVSFTDPNGIAEVVNFTQKITYQNNKLLLQLDLGNQLTALAVTGTYKIDIKNTTKYLTTVNSQDYAIIPFSGTGAFENKVSATELKDAESKAGTVGALAPGAGGGVQVTLTLFAFISADPTGLVMRVSQVLQVVSKLAFINLNYGKKLEAFFSKIGEMFEGFGSPKDDKYVWKAKYSRGKLSAYRVNLDLINKYWLRLFPYILSWCLKIWIYYIPIDKVVPRWSLYIFYMLPKIHALLFNLVFFDLIFYSARSLLHARQLPWSSFFGFLGLMMLSADFVSIFSMIIDNSGWRKLYIYFKKQQPPSKKEVQTLLKAKLAKKLSHVPDELLTSEESETEEERQLRTSRQIDYPKTWKEIKFDYHMYDFLSEFLIVDKKVYSSIACRCYYFVHISRISSYHMIVVAGQYLSGFVVSALIFVELFKVVYTLYFYIKYRYLKFLVLVFMEITQSIILGSFLGMVMYAHSKSSDIEMSEGQQTIGLYLVLLSVAMEYVLLIFYIVVLFGSAVANARRLTTHKKRQYYVDGVFHPKKIPFSFIQFVDDAEVRRQKNFMIKGQEIYESLINTGKNGQEDNPYKHLIGSEKQQTLGMSEVTSVNTSIKRTLTTKKSEHGDTGNTTKTSGIASRKFKNRVLGKMSMVTPLSRKLTLKTQKTSKKSSGEGQTGAQDLDETEYNNLNMTGFDKTFMTDKNGEFVAVNADMKHNKHLQKLPEEEIIPSILAESQPPVATKITRGAVTFRKRVISQQIKSGANSPGLKHQVTGHIDQSSIEFSQASPGLRQRQTSTTFGKSKINSPEVGSPALRQRQQSGNFNVSRPEATDLGTSFAISRRSKKSPRRVDNPNDIFDHPAFDIHRTGPY